MTDRERYLPGTEQIPLTVNKAGDIKMLGGIIETQAASSPERARGILTAAYSWVRFSGKLKFGKDLCAAYDYLNGAAAGMIVDSFRHPKDSVMVNK